MCSREIEVEGESVTNTNFKNIKVGERFKTELGVFVKMKPAHIRGGHLRNAAMIERANPTEETTLRTYFNFGNVAVQSFDLDE